MSRKRSCLNNAPMESFFHSLKSAEHILVHSWMFLGKAS